MDTKALAKSKRAHSLQHSKRQHHPNQKPKAPSGGATENANKQPSGKQVVKEKPLQPRGKSGLPSNWDRYEEEFDSGSEDNASGIGANRNQNPDVVLPKSKGADYHHLIAEAQSQSLVSLDSFPSVDDVLAGEFSQAFGSMLSVKGEGILAWAGDDNFIVEDKLTAQPEAAFLSLNLHALAEQLEKIDLAQRLFIEADLLPPELRGELSQASSTQERYQMLATNDVEAVREPSKELTVTEVSSSASPGGGYPDPSLSIRGSTSVSQVVSDVNRASQYDYQSETPDSAAQSLVNSFAETEKKPPEFEAVAAEAELDMLLDSFSEIKILDSSGLSSADTLPVQKEASVAAFQLPRKDPDLSASTPFNLDDDLDDLLKATSSLTSQNSLFPPQGGAADPFVQSSSPKSGTKSKALDDFDSWLDTL
ncbi:hypothetical protein TIFTF001_023007 [Ficus carica]|uniref:Uncharacterized protein n=1 Tax=Ficus carica TaxID=3494 RepID=A0AA88AZT9_FICCA|nr:hypothetical protein TIFTF001_023007 [Ficus carica]